MIAAHPRQADVGRIEPPAHTDLQDDGASPAGGEVQQGHRGGDSRSRSDRRRPGRSSWATVRSISSAPQAGRGRPARPIRRGAGLPVDGDPLLDRSRWGEVNSPVRYPAPGSTAPIMCGRGPLALGAGDVNDLEARLRIARPGQEVPHAVELERPLGVGHGEGPLVVGPLVEEPHRGVVLSGLVGTGRAGHGDGVGSELVKRRGQAPRWTPFLLCLSHIGSEPVPVFSQALSGEGGRGGRDTHSAGLDSILAEYLGSWNHEVTSPIVEVSSVSLYVP